MNFPCMFPLALSRSVFCRTLLDGKKKKNLRVKPGCMASETRPKKCVASHVFRLLLQNVLVSFLTANAALPLEMIANVKLGKSGKGLRNQ